MSRNGRMSRNRFINVPRRLIAGAPRSCIRFISQGYVQAAIDNLTSKQKFTCILGGPEDVFGEDREAWKVLQRKKREAAEEKAAAEKAAEEPSKDPSAAPVDPQPGASSSEGVATRQKEGESQEEDPESMEPPVKRTRTQTGALKKPPASKKAEPKKAKTKFGEFVGPQPPRLPNVYKDLEMKEASSLGFSSAGEYLRLKAYFDLNGGHDILPSEADGSCMFHSVLMLMETPQEYTPTHLRRDMVLLMAEYPDYFLDLLYDDLVGTYPQPEFRMTKAEFEARKDTLSQMEIDDYNTPGPFSYCQYLSSLLQSNHWGETCCLKVLSCLFQVPIAVVDSEDLVVYRVRNKFPIQEQDIVLILQGKRHYMPACEYSIIYRVVYVGIVLISSDGVQMCLSNQLDN